VYPNVVPPSVVQHVYNSPVLNKNAVPDKNDTVKSNSVIGAGASAGAGVVKVHTTDSDVSSGSKLEQQNLEVQDSSSCLNIKARATSVEEKVVKKKISDETIKCRKKRSSSICSGIEFSELHENDPNYPNKRDVICARGAESRFHPGNQRFRMIIEQHCESYMDAPKRERQLYTKKIVKMIHEGGGRFMKRREVGNQDGGEPGTCAWYEIDARSSREKVSQSLREKGAMYIDRKKLLTEEPHSEEGMLLMIQDHLFQLSLKKLEGSGPSRLSAVEGNHVD